MKTKKSSQKQNTKYIYYSMIKNFTLFKKKRRLKKEIKKKICNYVMEEF